MTTIVTNQHAIKYRRIAVVPVTAEEYEAARIDDEIIVRDPALGAGDRAQVLRGKVVARCAGDGQHRIEVLV